MSEKAYTPLQCQLSLCREIEKITEKMRFKDAGGEHGQVPMAVYAQRLPVVSSQVEVPEYGDTIEYSSMQSEDPFYQCPWCCVMLYEGKTEGPGKMQEATFKVTFGIYNDDPTNKGHQELLVLFQQLYERFWRNPILDGCFECFGGYDWRFDLDEPFPYFYGTATIKFRFMGVSRDMPVF